MAGHAQLKFVMTECAKTQIHLTGLIWKNCGTVRKTAFLEQKISDCNKPLVTLHVTAFISQDLLKAILQSWHIFFMPFKLLLL